MGSLAVSGGAEPGGALKEGGGVNGRDLLPPAFPSGHLNSPQGLGLHCQATFSSILSAAKGEQNRGAEAGAHSLPWLHRRQGGGSELWEQTVPWLSGAWPRGNGSVQAFPLPGQP